jgi:hypothetical protein
MFPIFWPIAMDVAPNPSPPIVRYRAPIPCGARAVAAAGVVLLLCCFCAPSDDLPVATAAVAQMSLAVFTAMITCAPNRFKTIQQASFWAPASIDSLHHLPASCDTIASNPCYVVACEASSHSSSLMTAWHVACAPFVLAALVRTTVVAAISRTWALVHALKLRDPATYPAVSRLFCTPGTVVGKALCGTLVATIAGALSSPLVFECESERVRRELGINVPKEAAEPGMASPWHRSFWRSSHARRRLALLAARDTLAIGLECLFVVIAEALAERRGGFEVMLLRGVAAALVASVISHPLDTLFTRATQASCEAVDEVIEVVVTAETESTEPATPNPQAAPTRILPADSLFAGVAVRAAANGASAAVRLLAGCFVAGLLRVPQGTEVSRSPWLLFVFHHTFAVRFSAVPAQV